MEKTYEVGGMTCAACATHVEKSVSKLEGISNIQINVLTGRMRLSIAPGGPSDEAVIAAVQAAGYSAGLPQSAHAAPAPRAKPDYQQGARGMRRRFIVSLIFTLPLFYLAMGHMMGWPLPALFLGEKNAMTLALTEFLLTLPVLIINREYFANGFSSLFKGAPNMNSLIAIGSGAAVVYGVYALYR
nr:cation transporter [bacterium]